ncbi:hypothetical protein C0995_000676 [Termitomyces sp. Mi166|nr:hypothetical protein C0995_000676 [Termitomyces sp. Mi166\
MTVFYRYDLNRPTNAKADISESPGLLEGDDRFVVILDGGLPVASVPVLTVFKLCALCRGSRSGQPGCLLKDATDLIHCLIHLNGKHQITPLQVQEILNGPDEEFTWMKLRQTLTRVEQAGYIKAALVQVGFPSIDVYGS